MQKQSLSLLFSALLAGSVFAQSPLTTTFLNNNGGAVGGGVYFDLNVLVPTISVTGLNLNLTGTGSVEVYTCPVTRLGNQSNAAVWTLVSTGAVTGAVAGVQSPVAITPFVLPAGTQGIAFKAIGVSHSYTNGTGANQNYATTELALAAGEAANVCFAGTPFTPRVVNCSIAYSAGGGGTVLATNTTLGVGCVKKYTSFYESFATSAAFDLANTAITMVPSGGGYVVLNGGSFLPVGSVQAVPTVLTLGDDTSVTQPFTTGSFPGAPGGLTVCSNGFVSLATGNGSAFTPSVATLLNDPQTSFRSWHDYNPSIVGSGTVKFEESVGVSTVTWDGVWDFFGTSVADASNLQFQFYATGQVVIAWGAMSPVGASGSGHLVGFSPGGASADPAGTDISALGAGAIVLEATDVLPLTLAALNRPIQQAGPNNWNLQVSNVPAIGLGLDIFGLGDPGILDLSLFGLGQPNCQLRASLDIVQGPWFAAGVNHNYSFTIPNTPVLNNFHLFTQSVVLDATVNLALTITSNGIDGKIGDF